MTKEQRRMFDALLVDRYEDAMREHQKVRREMVLAQCAEKEAEEEIKLLEWKIRLVELCDKKEPV